MNKDTSNRPRPSNDAQNMITLLSMGDMLEAFKLLTKSQKNDLKVEFKKLWNFYFLLGEMIKVSFYRKLNFSPFWLTELTYIILKMIKCFQICLLTSEIDLEVHSRQKK